MSRLVCIGLLVLLVMPSVLAAVYVKPEDIKFREGGVHRLSEYLYDPRIQYKKLETWIHLTPPQAPIFARGYPHYYPRGTARIQSVRSAYKPSGRVHIQVKDLRTSYYDNSVYQAWLYDSDSGYSFNLGRFEAREGNNAEMSYSGSHYFDAYDFVMITRERKDDIDPRPSSDEVLIGRMVQKDFYEPLPLLGEREQSGYTYYGE
jgi:hypothetical protein